MKRKRLLSLATAMIMASSLWAQTDVTESYIGDVTWIVNGGGHNHSSSNHKESDGIGWWNNQNLPSGWHAYVAPNADGGIGESWSPGFGSSGVMMGRTVVLPAGNYTLSFEAFACNATNSADPNTLPQAGDAVAFLTGETDVDITNTAAAGDATFHNVSFTFDVTTANTAYEFGIKKLTDGSKIDWCQIRNVKLTLNSTNIFAVPNNSVNTFTYSGDQTWHTNYWSTEGQRDGSRFQVRFHELWVASGGKLADATIKGSYTPAQTGVYKVSAWVRAMNEAGGAVTGAKIFVGDVESDACSGESVNSGKGRLGTYTAMADGVEGTPIEYGFKIENAQFNWLAFKNVTITYLGSMPEDEVNTLLAQVPTGYMNAEVEAALNTAVSNFETTASVANYNALATAISNANASIGAYNEIADYNALVAALSETAQTFYADALASYNNRTATDASAAKAAYEAALAYDTFQLEKAKAIALGMDETEVNGYENIQDLMVAEYDFVSDNYQYEVEVPSTWTTDNATDRSGQHWDGTNESTYSEQNNGWGDNTWSCSYSQDITLPAGNYVFKVAGRKSSDYVTLTLEVKNGNSVIGTVNDFPNGDTGLGINTSGATDFSSSSTYANNGTGRGWQWRYVKFTLDEATTVTIAVKGNADGPKYQWLGFCNATVLTDNADIIANVPGTLGAGKFATRIFPFKPEKKEGVNFYSCATKNGNALTLIEVPAPEANTPYILENTTEGEISIAQKGFDFHVDAEYTVGLLTGVFAENTITSGYVLQTQNDKQAFYKVVDPITVPAYRAYLNTTSEVKAFFLGGDATAINTLEVLTSGAYEGIYSVDGVKLNRIEKGVNILKMADGTTRKVIVK